MLSIMRSDRETSSCGDSQCSAGESLGGADRLSRGDEESSPEMPEHHVASWKINSLFFLGLSVILVNLISV